MTPYTQDELEFLRENYSKLTQGEIMKMVVHSWPSIKTKARQLHVRRRIEDWTDEQETILRNLYASGTRPQIITSIGRDWEAIKTRARKLGLKRAFAQPVNSILETRPVLDLSDAEKSWIAAGIDFEGTIGFNHMRGKALDNKYRPYIALTNTNVELCKTFASILKLPTKLDYRDFSDNPMHKPAWMARTHDGARVYSILENIKPHLIAKKTQADCVMEFLEEQEKRYQMMRADGLVLNYTERQLELITLVHKLNKRGRW